MVRNSEQAPQSPKIRNDVMMQSQTQQRSNHISYSTMYCNKYVAHSGYYEPPCWCHEQPTLDNSLLDIGNVAVNCIFAAIGALYVRYRSTYDDRRFSFKGQRLFRAAETTTDFPIDNVILSVGRAATPVFRHVSQLW